MYPPLTRESATTCHLLSTSETARVGPDTPKTDRVAALAPDDHPSNSKAGKHGMALSDEHLRMLGGITERFQFLELTLAVFSWSLIGQEQPIGQIVTAQMSFKNLCTLVGSLVQHRIADSALQEEARKLLARAAKVEEDRNRIIHSMWGVRDDPLPAIIVRIKITARGKKGLDFKTEQMTVDMLKTVANKVQRTAQEVLAFMAKIEQQGFITLPLE